MVNSATKNTKTLNRPTIVFELLYTLKRTVLKHTTHIRAVLQSHLDHQNHYTNIYIYIICLIIRYIPKRKNYRIEFYSLPSKRAQIYFRVFLRSCFVTWHGDTWRTKIKFCSIAWQAIELYTVDDCSKLLNVPTLDFNNIIA